MVHLTIRARIIFWFGLIITAILCAFSVLVYFNFQTALLANTDDFLELKAEGVLDYIDAYWVAQNRKGLENSRETASFIKTNSRNFVKIAQNRVGEIPVDPALTDISLSIFSTEGQLLASSDSVAKNKWLSPQALKAVLKGKSFFDPLVGNLSRQPQASRRIITVPVVEGNTIICILQLAKPLTDAQRTLNQLKIKLAMFLPVSILLVVVAAWLLASLILHPLKSIIHTVRHITADKLSSRVPLFTTKDEIRDLSETFNDMLEKLEKAFLMQERIVQDVSHELRTPLTILKGEMEVALKKARSPEEYQATLTSGLEEINKINHMVENLLLLARFDSHQSGLVLKEIDFESFVQGIIDDMSLFAKQKSIVIHTDLTKDVFIRADEQHLYRALINILDNAVKYTPQGGNIFVTLKKTPDMTVLGVADTGIGIDPNRLPFIFDRFYRADTSRSSRGFGLGLSIAKTIIDAHDGKIEVTSLLKRGTSFLVSFPLA
ncbi:MAG: HAMP domain-containing protein [Candidatus Omnitrophica bacterium]|nr:HAMP domain-containing protein [Candidatus Omnitrophota bacterium]